MSDPETSSREEEIFYRALEIADLTERAAYLARVCDTGLRKIVDAMLADHARAETILADCADALAWPDALGVDAVASAAADAEIGAKIGPYTLIRRLGEGSGGIVYEAAQETPVRRRVALKILKAGLDTQRVIARFEAERQTLALMEHPNIARVIDAGATDSGRPYFVMELVHGTRITAYCEQARSDVSGRLRLLQQVCSAILHAHQKGVIHRDLKPSNILISVVDDTPVPKVIDFGIAKAVAELSPAPFAPEPGIGTPAYMSPEQRRGAAESDTRSDIYSLGIVLRELLVGRRPLAGYVESNEQALASSHLPADLAWIVRKATDENPERRYQTVRGFAQDLENFLTGQPVEAHPPGAVYRAGKLIRRNKLASVALAAAVAAIIGGMSVSTFLLFRTRAAERQEARLRMEAEEREHVARAAILIMQGKPAAAHDEIERMRGPLTQPSVEATHVFKHLANWSALNGDWRTAGERLLSLSRVSRFDDTDQSDNATRDLVPIAPTLIEAGDLAGYRDFHRRLLERLGQTQNPIAAEQILKGCLLLPEKSASLAVLDSAAAVAQQSLASVPFVPGNYVDAWRCAALGLWSYRLGRFEESVHWCDRALALQDDEHARHAYSRVVRAMALNLLGRTGEARNDREIARRQIDATFLQPLEFRNQGYWHDWLAARILLREASDGFPAEPIAKSER
jgi:serine/threonine protein kinase